MILPPFSRPAETDWPNIEARSALRIANENLRVLRADYDHLESRYTKATRINWLLCAALIGVVAGWVLMG